MAQIQQLTQELEASLPDIELETLPLPSAEELDLEKSLLPSSNVETNPPEKVSTGLGDKALGGVAQFTIPEKPKALQEKQPIDHARHDEHRKHGDEVHPTLQPSLRKTAEKPESQDETIDRLEKSFESTSEKPSASREVKHHSALHHPAHAEPLTKPRPARMESKTTITPEKHHAMEDMTAIELGKIIEHANRISEEASEILNKKLAAEHRVTPIEVSNESLEAEVIKVVHGEHHKDEKAPATPKPQASVTKEGLSWDEHRAQYNRAGAIARGMSVPSIVRTPHNEPALPPAPSLPPPPVEVPRVPEKTEAEKALEKATFDRWWSGMKHRLGVQHWEKSWNQSGKESVEALNKDITAEMTSEVREAKRQQNRHDILLGRAAGINYQEKIIQDLDAAHLSEADQQSLLDEVGVRIGEAIEANLTEAQRNEYKAIFDANQPVIAAWLEQHEPNYKETDIYTYVAAGYETDQEKVQPEKVVASLGWVNTNVPNLEEVISKVVAAFKAERATTV